MNRLGSQSRVARILAGLLVLNMAAPALVADDRPRPNIIVILADDLGFADVGFSGCKDIPTPNIDSLATQGVRFTNGYVSHPFCSPTRAGLMTGRYQQRFGHENNPKYDPKDTVAGLPVTEVTIAQVLKSAGYVTGIVGKWHLGAAPRFHPNRRGFDEFFGFIGGGHNYFPGTAKGGNEYNVPIEFIGKDTGETGYLTTAFGREAAAFVQRHKDHPFFLYLAFNAPHTPLMAPPEYLAKFAAIGDPKRRTYAAMVNAMDDAVGVVLAKLRELDLDQRTLVFFLSDNGGPIGINGSSNGPLRAGKGSVYDGGIHVPFVARWVGRLPRGATYDQPVISLDILPTAAALAGAEVPDDRPIDGVNILPFVLGAQTGMPHDILFWRRGGGADYASRVGPLKLVRIGRRPDELYRLTNDIGESDDLASGEADRVKQIGARLAGWNSQLIAPLFQSPRPGKAKPKTKAGPKKSAGSK
jgi:arylsulfatase A-like enzyme